MSNGFAYSETVRLSEIYDSSYDLHQSYWNDTDDDNCVSCGDIDAEYIVDGKHMCASCARKHFIVDDDTQPCVECGEYDEDDICYKVDGDCVCGECLFRIYI